MKRTKQRMRRRKHPKIYAVRIKHLDNYYWVSTRHNKWAPYYMTRKRAIKLLIRLQKKYHGNFYIDKK